MNQNLYAVVHIPKTAGSTLKSNFERNFKREEWLYVTGAINIEQGENIASAVELKIGQRDTTRTRCVFGHWVYWGIHRVIRPECTPRYITFLREPIARCISWYDYIKTQPENQWHQPIMENQWTMGEFLQQGNPTGLHNNQTRFLLSDGSNDFMTESLTREHLEVAKQRLQQYWFVGLTESFDEDSLYLYGKLNFLRFHHTRVVNATVTKTLISPEERQALLECNALDIELYQFAHQLRAQWLRDHATDFRLQQYKARILRSIYLTKGMRRFSR